MSDTLKKNFILLIALSLITSPLLITTTHANNSGFSSHGYQANPLYANPTYANPLYANPAYANPLYANPIYATPSYGNPNYGNPAYANPNYGVVYEGTTYYMGNWGLERMFPIVNEDYPQSQLINDIKTDKAIQIAVLDTGIDLNHPDLSDSVTWTYDATGGNDMTDVSGHGTHVAGIVDLFGIAEIYAIKVMDGPNMEGEWSWLTNGINAAVAGPDGTVGTSDDADIISMSLGSQGEVPPVDVENAIRDAHDRDIFLVASAGNSGDGDISTDDLVQYPAAYNDVIAVGATDYDNNLAYFSNTNSYVDIVAPGVDILSTFLDGEHVFWSGTSMAAPHIAALIAFELYTGWNDPISNFIMNYFGPLNLVKTGMDGDAIDLGETGKDNGYGSGLAQYQP